MDCELCGVTRADTRRPILGVWRAVCYPCIRRLDERRFQRRTKKHHGPADGRRGRVRPSVSRYSHE
jgi:hypothetical protein